MNSSLTNNTTNKDRKKSLRVSFAPGTKFDENPEIDDLTKILKGLPLKPSSPTSPSSPSSFQKKYNREAESINNMFLQFRKSLDDMLEQSSQLNNKFNPERRPSNSSFTSVDSAISDCSQSYEYYNQLNIKEEELNTNNINSMNITSTTMDSIMNSFNCCDIDDDLDIVNKDTQSISSSISSPLSPISPSQEVFDLIKELDNCIEELKEENIYSPEEELFETSLCVKDVFVNGIVIASFLHIKTEITPLEQHYVILTDNKIYIFESNRSKSPIQFTFSFNNKSTITKSRNSIELYGEYHHNLNNNEVIANRLSLLFSTEKECQIWSKLLYNTIKNFNTNPNSNSKSQQLKFPKRTVSLNANVNNNLKFHINNNDLTSDFYHPRQALLSTLKDL